MKDFVRFIGFVFVVLLVLGTLVLSGCARKTPTETIIDTHVEHIDDTLNFAHNNFEQNSDVVFLENELRNCQLVLVDVKQSYYGELGTCKAKINYWRLATFGLFVALCAACFMIFKKMFKI